MEDRREYLERFRIENENTLKDTAKKICDDLGEDGNKINSLLQDKDKISAMVNGLSDSDFNKLKQVMDNPQILQMILSSEKAKKNLAKILGEL